MAKAAVKGSRNAAAKLLEQKAAAIAACRDKAGRLTPRAVWHAARDPNSILHNDFDWDAKAAAEKFWDMQASELIRKVKFVVEYDERKVVVPFYVSDPRETTSSYIATSRVARNAKISERVLRDEIARIEAAIRRATNLAMAFGLASSFERMLQEITDIEARLGGLDDEREEARA